MSGKKEETEKRKAYEKPVIRIVNISDSVQVLGIGCKSTTFGIAGPTTNPCVPGIRCNQPGS